jgi:hypothetical protein
MPRPSTQPLRLAAWGSAVLLAACSGGGSGGGGSASGGTTTSGATTNVTLAWSKASGPVAGYAVYVQRDGGAYKHEYDVSQPQVTVAGSPGSTASVIVVAFDAVHAQGPTSPSSRPFTFPPVATSTTAASEAGAVSVAAAGANPVDSGSASTTDAVATTAAVTAPSEEPTSALPGTLVWASGDAFRLTDAALQTTRLFAPPAEGAQLAAVADFDADGQGDLLWVDASSQLAYTPGSALRSTAADPIPPVAFGALAADERVIGAGDFDGDGDGDLLIASGDAIRVRLSLPGTAPAIVELGTASQAVLTGVADFDGNGSEDIAWRASTGALVLWLLDRGNLAASVEVALAGSLEPLGVGDFDGDGAAEVALRAPNGTAYIVHPLAATPSLVATDLTNTDVWYPVGADDLDGDGSDELVLATGGAIRIARLPGDQILSLELASPWQLVALLP